MSILKVNDIEEATVGGGKIFPARAYCNYTSTGTVTIREDGNISSLTDNSVGNTQADFTNSFANANWSAGLGDIAAQTRLSTLASQTSSAIRLISEDDAGLNEDSEMTTFIVVGTLA